MNKSVVHLLVHHCGPQECDCLPLCKGRAVDPVVSTAESLVTCKTCLRSIGARLAKIESLRVAYKADLYDEVWALAKSYGFSNVTEAIEIAARVKS